MKGNAEFFELVEPKPRWRSRKLCVIICILVVLVVLLIVGLTIGLMMGTDSSSNGAKSHEEARRIDCYPEASSPQEEVDKAKCEARGCEYSPSANPAVPVCYYPEDGPNTGLKVLSEEILSDGMKWILEVKPGSKPFNSNINVLDFTVQELSNHLIRFKLEDAADPDRYQVPSTLHLPHEAVDNPLYRYRVQSDPFRFLLIRRDTGVTVWDTSVGGLIFTDQFLQIATSLPTKNVYGFGENVHSTFKHDMNFRSWPMFARDQFPDENENNLYGVHPFYECVEEDGKAHGVFLLNSNALEYAFTPAPMLIYRTIGGIFDFYITMGPSPENVIQQYTGLIGRPYMPPYWALGFQLCRYGYKNTSDIKSAVQRTIDYDIPLDVQYADIDYMDNQRDFTIDEENFGDLPEYFREIQSRGTRVIIILDPCIEINDTYQPYLMGRERDIYIKWSSREVMPPGDYEEYNNTDMMGYVWPNWKVVFPDFFDPRTEDVWTDLVVDFKDRINFDGIWIDMNEPANFGTNEEKAWNWAHVPPYWTLKCPNSSWDDPPYRPKAAYVYDSEDKKSRLSDKTICMQGVQANGTLRHYDVHNLYGHVQSQVTLRAMRKALANNKRGQQITRSTFAGSGAFAGHWLGDNASIWPHLRVSIIGLLEFNLFGIPYVGADICGFFGTATAELCKRWMQLGAFYTFARNHNHEASGHQDPGYYGDEVAVASREALQTRYRLLPYLYTLFHKAHVQGNTVIRPLFHEFPLDKTALAVDRQFLWGPALLISPILEEKQTSLSIYLPDGPWYNYYTGLLEVPEAGYLRIPVQGDSPIPLHIRGGHIIPVQQPGNNTFFSRRNGFGLLVALSDDGSAEGDLFWDDGESIDTFERGSYYSSLFRCSENQLQMEVQHNDLITEMAAHKFENVTVMGVSDVTRVYVNGSQHGRFTYSNDRKVLYITHLNLGLSSNFIIQWGKPDSFN